jgi:hypothetical protein
VSQCAGAARGRVSSAKKVTRAPSSSVEPAAESACWYEPAWKRMVAPAHAGGTGAVPVAVRPAELAVKARLLLPSSVRPKSNRIPSGTSPSNG